MSVNLTSDIWKDSVTPKENNDHVIYLESQNVAFPLFSQGSIFMYLYAIYLLVQIPMFLYIYISLLPQQSSVVAGLDIFENQGLIVFSSVKIAYVFWL